MTKLPLILASLLLCTHAGAAEAHEFSAYAEASAQFSKLTAAAAKQRRMPRMSDPAAAKVIATLSDSKRFLETHAFRAEDLAQLMEMCDAANRANMTYAMFDLGSHVNKSMTDPAKVAVIVQNVVGKNFVTFQDEIGQLGPFNHRCLGRQVGMLADFVKTLTPEQMTAERLDGLAQMRRGIASTYVGMATLVNTPAVNMRNRKKLIDAMAETAPQYAAVLEPSARKQIRDFAASSQAAAPRELAGQLGKIIEAMSQTRCEGLCQLSTTVEKKP